MKDITDVIITNDFTIRAAMQTIQKGSLKIALIVDSEKKLLGTLSDGDIRRALLSESTLDDNVGSIINNKPFTCKVNDSKEKILHLAHSKKLHLIPIVDDENVLIGVEDIDLLSGEIYHENIVVLMVGGLGTRLQPLTNDLPKPLLKIGEKPILETIIENFAKYGFVNIILCVNYKGNMIEDYFGDGSSYGVNLTYVTEDKRLGTAGALSLLKDKPTQPFFVMNGDLLTNINFEHMLNFHETNNASATMSVREIETQIAYGVIETENNRITSIREKPIQKILVNAGIYILEPEVLEYVPKNDFFDMPTLYEILIQNKKNVLSYLNSGYWIDIGQLEDYKKANTILGKEI